MRPSSRVPLAAAIPKSMSFTVPSRVIMMLLGLMSRWTMRARSKTYCRARQTRLTMKTQQVHLGPALLPLVAVQEVDEGPAVDVLEDDAELADDAVEVEDAADVLVVEQGVAPGLVHEELHVAGLVRVAELLDHDGALEPGLPHEDTLPYEPHAARPELVGHAVLWPFRRHRAPSASRSVYFGR